MQTFTDNEGQQWTLALTLGKVRKIRDSIGLDLLNTTHYLQLLQSLTDQMAYCFLLVESQSKANGIHDADEFEERLYGAGISDAASTALIKETEDFFLKLGQSALASLAKVSMESKTMGQAKLTEMIASGQIDSAIAKAREELAAM